MASRNLQVPKLASVRAVSRTNAASCLGPRRLFLVVAVSVRGPRRRPPHRHIVVVRVRAVVVVIVGVVAVRVQAPHPLRRCRCVSLWPAPSS